MSTYKKLANDTFIFAIGSMGSKLINFLLIPLYTFYLSTEEYGTVDYITVLTTLFLPFVTLSIFQAVLRFAMDTTQDKTEVFTIGILITICFSILILIVYPILNFLNVLEGYLFLLIFLLIVQSFQQLLADFIRAIGEIKIFATNGIFMAIVIGLLNIVFIAYFNFGINGYIYSVLIGNISSIAFLFFTAKVYTYMNFSKVNISLVKKMLFYSVPLIPNTISLKITDTASRFFIIYFISTSANGIFALANKIPQLLSMLYQIFFQAWQLTAIEQFDSKNKSETYSDVFKFFSSVMFIGTSFILVILKTVMKFIVAPDFFVAWKYIPFLLLSTVFSSFSGFLGTNYIAAKQTKGVFKTTIIGAIINVVLNFILIPIMGINGAGLSSMISYAVIFIIRYFDTKKYIDIKVKKVNFLLNLVVIFFQTLFLFFIRDTSKLFFVQFFLFLLTIIVNYTLFKNILKIMKNKLKIEFK